MAALLLGSRAAAAATALDRSGCLVPLLMARNLGSPGVGLEGGSGLNLGGDTGGEEEVRPPSVFLKSSGLSSGLTKPPKGGL